MNFEGPRILYYPALTESSISMFLYFHILDENSDQEEVSPDSLRVDSL